MHTLEESSQYSQAPLPQLHGLFLSTNVYMGSLSPTMPEYVIIEQQLLSDLRCLLIQVQKLKADVEQEMLDMDKVHPLLPPLS